MPTNCVNCGAPLTGSKCQYCGTEYGDASDSVKKQKAELMEQFLKASISAQQAFVISGLNIEQAQVYAD